MKLINYLVISLGISLYAATSVAASCHPEVDKTKQQFLIGYGSLLNNESKNRTYHNTGENIPIIIDGYERGWFTRGDDVNFSTTYLGVVANKSSKINAVAFQVPDLDAIALYDQREKYYCREEIPQEKIRALANSLADGQYWMYVNSHESMKLANAKFPIVQSYVDIFIGGCLEIQDKYQLPNYAENCIIMTTKWSSHWVNDRIYPRRPFMYQPNAGKIDKLLISQLPKIYSQIKIE